MNLLISWDAAADMILNYDVDYNLFWVGASQKTYMFVTC